MYVHSQVLMCGHAKCRALERAMSLMTVVSFPALLPQNLRLPQAPSFCKGGLENRTNAGGAPGDTTGPFYLYSCFLYNLCNFVFVSWHVVWFCTGSSCMYVAIHSSQVVSCGVPDEYSYPITSRWKCAWGPTHVHWNRTLYVGMAHVVLLPLYIALCKHSYGGYIDDDT